MESVMLEGKRVKNREFLNKLKQYLEGRIKLLESVQDSLTNLNTINEKGSTSKDFEELDIILNNLSSMLMDLKHILS